MGSERGQASVEWVGLVLLLGLALGALVSVAPKVDGRSLGGTLAHRITCSVKRDCGGEELAGGGVLHVPVRREGPSLAAVAPVIAPVKGGPAELIKTGTRRAVAADGLACYLRESTAPEDTNRPSDDVGDAINCLNPFGGWTGEVGGTDG